VIGAEGILMLDVVNPDTVAAPDALREDIERLRMLHCVANSIPTTIQLEQNYRPMSCDSRLRISCPLIITEPVWLKEITQSTHDNTAALFFGVHRH
jgi:hypothetical protein